MHGGRGEDECHVAFGERREASLERGSEGMDLGEELAVGHAAAGGCFDEDCFVGNWCGGVVELRESVVCDGERLRRRRKWDFWAEAMVCFGFVAVAAFWVD